MTVAKTSCGRDIGSRAILCHSEMDISSSLLPAVDVTRPFSHLVFPALVDSTLHDRPVIVIDPPDEEHLDVVFNRDKLRVVDPRFWGNMLIVSRHLHANWLEAQPGLIWQWFSNSPLLIDDAVLVRLDTVLPASLLPVRQDRPMLKVSIYVQWVGE